MTEVHKFFQLPPNERLILAQAWGLFLLTELALRVLPFTHLLSLSRKKSVLKRMGNPSLPPFVSVLRLSRLVEVAGRYTHAKVMCLKTALILSWLLGRRGISTELRIGVTRESGSFKAHAWLDHDGHVIPGHQEGERYELLLGA
ncbi:lasso peptide biosynthesis B2 protein [Candidatus Methylomirabilis sp.]|uniref:lasso peptide biosynthesis B2 protein n=1 Tax=Candidatus Methylomirabilis sp. TaxID=2032687 RepID=UPI002A6311DB|nr:lasso peptide biosynthesis B2 protein [Candidatus Methylomirabilis sp.]